MNTMRTSLFGMLAAAIGWVSTAQSVQAQLIRGGFQDRVQARTGLGTTQPINVVAAVIQVVLSLLSIIALGMILYSGFRWLTAGGNSDQVADAKRTLLYAVIGLIIVMGSLGISVFIFAQIEGATGIS